MKYEFYGMTFDLEFMKATYACNNGLAIQAIYFDEEMNAYDSFATVTVCLNHPFEEGNKAFVDVNNSAGLVSLLTRKGCIKPTGYVQRSGYVEYPLYEFKQEWLDSLKEMY